MVSMAADSRPFSPDNLCHIIQRAPHQAFLITLGEGMETYVGTQPDCLKERTDIRRCKGGIMSGRILADGRRVFVFRVYL